MHDIWHDGKEKANNVAKTQEKATLAIMDLIDSTFSSAVKQKVLEVKSTLQSSGQVPMTSPQRLQLQDKA
jgi:hypothetical protein